MTSPHAVVVPAAALAGAVEHAENRRAAALLASDSPLTADDRLVLQRSLGWWEELYVTAGGQARAIMARLAEPLPGSQGKPGAA